LGCASGGCGNATDIPPAQNCRSPAGGRSDVPALIGAQRGLAIKVSRQEAAQHFDQAHDCIGVGRQVLSGHLGLPWKREAKRKQT